MWPGCDTTRPRCSGRGPGQGPLVESEVDVLVDPGGWSGPLLTTSSLPSALQRGLKEEASLTQSRE